MEMLCRGDGPLQGVLDSLMRTIRHDMELACAGGSVLWIPRRRPDGSFSVESVSADRLSGWKFTPDGKLCAVTVRHDAFTDDGEHPCSLFERFVLEESGCRITRYACRNPMPWLFMGEADGLPDDATGEPMPLEEVAQWRALPGEELLEGCRTLPAALLRMPSCCRCSYDKPYGASVYAGAVGLIRDADLQFSRYQWEFEGGELAIDASEDLFRHNRAGAVLPAGKERLFRTNMLDMGSGGELMKIFSPALREEPLRMGLLLILSRIEDACGLARGALTETSSYDRTATEIKQSKQRFYILIVDIQKQITTALTDLRDALAALDEDFAGLDFEVSYGDSVVEDASSERVRDLEEVRAGVMTAEEFRAKWHMENSVKL